MVSNNADLVRFIDSSIIEESVRDMFISANYKLPSSCERLIKSAIDTEDNQLAKSILGIIDLNISAAKDIDVPICQDTGIAVVFVELGNKVIISGDDLVTAINKGVRRAYTEGYLRCSVVEDPLFDRVNTNDNTPAIIHTNIVNGDKVKITVLPKGFGSENMSAIKMMTPSATENDIVKFVVDTVKNAGANPCPPIILGIGIGGSFDYAPVLAKKALARNPDERNPDFRYAKLEKMILDEVNKLNIGPQGFGGKTTALAVNIEKYATHIAGLPVAVNISCHVTRHADTII